MNTKHLSIATLSLLTLGLAGCSNNDPEVNVPGGVADRDIVRYLHVAISNPPSSTRVAAEFEDGTTEENLIQDLYFKFYDATGNPIEGNSQIEERDFEDVSSTPPGSVGRIANVLVKISIEKGKQLPAYVIAFCNPNNYSDISDDTPMYDLRNVKREGFMCSDGKHFAMNNAVYYGFDPISGATGVKMNGAPILAENLYNSAEKAKDEEANIVDIYVERYAAKVRFTLADNAVADQTVGAYTLTFNPVAWTINADAAEMYASKRFNDSNSTTDAIPTLQQVNNMLSGWTTWNDPELHRSYWACSPSYYATDFPQVSDDIIEEAKQLATPSTGAGIVVEPYKLRYYSYNQIADQNTTNLSEGKGVTAMNDGGKNWKYVLENTMGAAAFASANPKAAAPSVVLVGEYTVKNGATTLNCPNGFCLYNNNLYFRQIIPAGAADGAKTIQDALMDLNGILAINENGTTMMTSKNLSATLKNCFEVVHPNKDVRNGQPVPHRYVTLQLKSSCTDAQLIGLYFKPNGSDQWVQIKAADITTINRLLWAQLGNARAYTGNKAYFSIPIQHLGMTENTNPSPIGENGSIDWTKVRVGDFGLVRNHVYSIGVSNIEGLGSGIEDLDNPIVPSMEEDTYWVKYKINVLNWRVVPAQENIILK